MEGIVSLTAASIGHAVFEFLKTEKNAIAWGETSKGLFVVTENKKIIFITDHTFKGPLTVNVIEKLPAYQTFSRETHILLSSSQIRFFESGLNIRITPQTSVWTPIILDMKVFDRTVTINRSKLIGRELSNHLSNRKSDLTLSIPGKTANRDQARENQTKMTSDLLDTLSLPSEGAVYESLSNFLGCGEGLTPSGDDFICGLQII